MMVWVNGTFDLLHRGHIELFKYAGGFGDVIVGIDFDERVKLLKGDSRPVNTFEDRKFILESIKYIKKVVRYGSDDELIEQIKESGAKVMVIGSDYLDKDIIGSHLFNKIMYFDRLVEYSTTKIIEHYK